MGLFSKDVSGPDVEHIKTTFENLCAELNAEKYDGGVCRDGVIRLVNDVYKWLVVSKDNMIRLPATVNQPEDTARFMFPEGARVSTRKSKCGSNVSSAASNLPKGYTSLSRKYTESRSSATSTSRYAAHYVGFAEDDDVPKPLAQHSQGRNSAVEQRQMPVRGPASSNRVHVDDINRPMMVPTKSVEHMIPPRQRRPKPRRYEDDDKPQINSRNDPVFGDD